MAKICVNENYFGKIALALGTLLCRAVLLVMIPEAPELPDRSEVGNGGAAPPEEAVEPGRGRAWLWYTHQPQTVNYLSLLPC